jgi:hypothetical protein
MMGGVPKSPEKNDRPSPGKDPDTLPVKVKGASKGKGQGEGGGQAQSGQEERRGPQNIIGPRVNLALPFSRIEVQEPTAELVEMAKLLSDLLSVIADWVPEEALADLRSRAEALSARLDT